MSTEAEIIKKMKAQIAEMLDMQAEKQIEEKVKQFKEELVKEKGRAIADIIGAIEIGVSHNPTDCSMHFAIYYEPGRR